MLSYTVFICVCVWVDWVVGAGLPKSNTHLNKNNQSPKMEPQREGNGEAI